MSKLSLFQNDDSKFEYQHMQGYSDMMIPRKRIGQSTTIDPYYFDDGIEDYEEDDDYDYEDNYNDSSDMPPLADIYRRDNGPSFMY